MHRFYAEPGAWRDGGITLAREEVHHLLHTARIRPNEPFVIFDGRGGEAHCVLPDGVDSRARDRDGLVVHPTSIDRHPEPTVAIYLFQALPKSGKLEMILEKGTELGVTRVVPFISDRSVVRMNPDRAGARARRWERVVLSAARQCGAAWLPRVDPVCSVTDCAAAVRAVDLVLLGSLTEAAEPVSTVLAGTGPSVRSVGVIVGPEGDLTPGESASFVQAGARPTGFGPRTLRAETAALFGLSVLAYHFGR